MSAGKGDTPRPVDKQKFDEGYDRIFKPKTPEPQIPDKATKLVALFFGVYCL